MLCKNDIKNKAIELENLNPFAPSPLTPHEKEKIGKAQLSICLTSWLGCHLLLRIYKEKAQWRLYVYPFGFSKKERALWKIFKIFELKKLLITQVLAITIHPTFFIRSRRSANCNSFSINPLPRTSRTLPLQYIDRYYLIYYYFYW